jgi:hypothetical protein
MATQLQPPVSWFKTRSTLLATDADSGVVKSPMSMPVFFWRGFTDNFYLLYKKKKITFANTIASVSHAVVYRNTDSCCMSIASLLAAKA